MNSDYTMAIHDPIHVFRFVKDIFVRYHKTIQFNRDKSCEVNERKKGCNSTPRDHIAFKAILWNLVNKFSLMSISRRHRPKSDRDLLWRLSANLARSRHNDQFSRWLELAYKTVQLLVTFYRKEESLSARYYSIVQSQQLSIWRKRYLISFYKFRTLAFCIMRLTPLLLWIMRLSLAFSIPFPLPKVSWNYFIAKLYFM